MTGRVASRVAFAVVAGLGLVLVLGGCVIRPTGPTAGTGAYYAAQPQPVVVAQPQPVVVQPAPVVVQPAPVVVSRPPVVVYRAPSPVRTPVRVYAAGVPIRPASYPVYSGYSPYPVYPTYGYPCMPGTTRVCEAYCGSGYQVCSADGSGWSACIEGGY